MNIKIKDKVEEIVKLTVSGLTNKEIADLIGANVPAIKYWQKKLGIKPNPVPVNKLSEDQKQQVLNLYSESKDAKLIAEKIGSTQYLVLSYLKEQGIDTSSRFFKGELAELAIEQYKSGMTQEEIANYHGCERQAVQSLFNSRGIKGRSQLEQKQITWYVNQKAFTNWNNEADLFFYGLLLADGCISDNNSISIMLQDGDESILYKLKDYMQSDNAVALIKKVAERHKDKYSFTFKDQIVGNNLRKVGMSPRKSANEQMPTFDLDDPETARHFWRGYICGDGSVRSYPANGNPAKMMPTLHICGSREICEGFRLFCSKVLNTSVDEISTVKTYNDKRRSKVLYYFRLNGSKARDVALFMFENAEYSIPRKTENALSFKNWKPRTKQ